jgi:MarR family transcriptional regulator, organic hydroperoxide resistance regulator
MGVISMEKLNFARFFGILSRESQTYMNIAFKDIGIGFSECLFLMNIYENEGINQEELSAMLFIDKAATARAIKSLEGKGFITRKMNEEDKRSKKMYLTDKGRDHKEYIFSLIKKWTDYITDGIDKETINVVFKSLNLMAERAGSANLNELLGYNENDVFMINKILNDD